MNVQPLRDFVVVKKDEAAKQTASGLYLTAPMEEKVVTGTIIAVGSGRLNSDGTITTLEVKVGDKVVFNKHIATEVKVGEETVLLLREDHIYCVVK